MKQDKVKFVCRSTTPGKTSIFLRGRIELFTGVWVGCCWVPKRYEAGWTENCMPRCNALKNGHLPKRKSWALTGVWVSCCWVPKRYEAGWSENCMPRCNALKNGHLPKRKSWALYRRVSELVLSVKEGWLREWEEWLQNRQRK